MQYMQAKSKEAQGIGNVYKNYYSQLGAENERLMAEGAKYSALETSVYDYVAGLGKDIFGEFASITPETALERNMYDVKNGGYELTDVGREFFRRALNQEMGATSFTNYLRQNDAELLDWYVQNKESVRNLVGGLKENESGLSNKEYADLMEARSRNRNIVPLSEIQKDNSIQKDFAMHNYNTETPSSLADRLKNNPWALDDGSINTKEDINIPKEITNNLKAGDYFKYNGQYYKYIGHGKFDRFITKAEYERRKPKNNTDEGSIVAG